MLEVGRDRVGIDWYIDEPTRQCEKDIEVHRIVLVSDLSWEFQKRENRLLDLGSLSKKHIRTVYDIYHLAGCVC